MHSFVERSDEQTMCGLTDLVSSCLSKASGGHSRTSSAQQPQPFLRASLFTGIPPTIRFYTKGTKVSKPNKKITNRLTWCHNSLLPIVMRHCLAASHFTIVDESLFYIGYWGRHLKSSQYRTLKPHQKVNHYPGAFHIGRKDRLWMHIEKQQRRLGEHVYDIMPKTYLLPKDYDHMRNYLAASPSNHVIIKPPASARGTGISVTRKVKEIPEKTQLVAQHYVDRPLTINGAKFDLRLYAYVPSLEPLRIYIYEEGLVRFASVPYSKCVSTVSNKYMHLTNYSINKLAEQDGVSDSPVPKWRLTELWKYFENDGINSAGIRERIEDVIIKAFIACEKPIRDHMVRHIQHGFICHELFGVDILLDEDLKPWLLEVNISPSLHSGTPLDISVKAPLAKDVLNMAGIYVPPSPEEMATADYGTRPRNWPKEEEHVQFASIQFVIWKHSPLDEYRRRGNFRLIFPTADTAFMQSYFVQPVYANLMLQQWQIEQEACGREDGISRLESLCRQWFLRNRESDEEC
ncbi:Tubulin-tyrosine ligase family protein [Ancylostoma ceylanicum]|uniref:Tubulin-tyrosine ligase family protein n=1 Tax=Ancylostoma ceylanicum TaxID=53326 RepID=A0A0D6LZK4_9BILA|nr:Tubulin-tyrosine ligase family protein [Ancylostoma ceylanicum]